MQGREASTDHEGRRDGYGSAEPGCAFDERAEAEGDQERLESAVSREAGDRGLHDLELPGLDGQAMEKNRCQHDPADGEQAKTCAVACRGESHLPGHAIDEN